MNKLLVKYGAEGYRALNAIIAEKDPSCIFVMTDSHTLEHCYPVLLPQIETTARIEIIEIDPGEQFKTIETCTGIWEALNELGCDRHSLVINLGGGVVTDLGGFIASTIKRGISFVQVPTSLLGMVDAAIGGKNGVDLGHLKNQVGTITVPEMVLIDFSYLRTLPKVQSLNGSIEMFKHGLIHSRTYWNDMLNSTDYHDENFESLIRESVNIKMDIVKVDPYEKNQRKFLNYGHTIGHAIEAQAMMSDTPMLHGEAVARGILAESWLSVKYAGLPKSDFDEIKTWYDSLHLPPLSELNMDGLLELMLQDKKNRNGQIRFVLLNKIGQAQSDITCTLKDIKTAVRLLVVSK